MASHLTLRHTSSAPSSAGLRIRLRGVLFMIFLFTGFPGLLPAVQSEAVHGMRASESQGGEPENLRPPVYPPDINGVVLSAMWVAADKAEDVVRHVGQNIGHYIREKHMEKTKSHLVEAFYRRLEHSLHPYALTETEELRIARQVEAVYIEDGMDGAPELDTVAFHDMPAIVKKFYTDMLLAETMNGEILTYDLKGRPETLWKIQHGRPHGVIVSYYPGGEIRYIDHYEKGQRIHRKKYNKDGRLEFEQSYDYREKDRYLSESSVSAAPDRFSGERLRKANSGHEPAAGIPPVPAVKNRRSVLTYYTNAACQNFKQLSYECRPGG